MELCVMACALELIEKYLRTRTSVAQEILAWSGHDQVTFVRMWWKVEVGEFCT